MSRYMIADFPLAGYKEAALCSQVWGQTKGRIGYIRCAWWEGKWVFDTELSGKTVPKEKVRNATPQEERAIDRAIAIHERMAFLGANE